MSENLGLIQKLTRLYTFYSPINKGKSRLALASLKLNGQLPKQVVATTKDGRTLRINFDTHFAHFVYFLGEYEKSISSVIQSIVKQGDICLDIGANIGWYTTLLQTLVGDSGEIHAFEPMPETYKILSENVESNQNASAVTLNRFALGETEKEIDLHLFENLGDGHASISDFGKSDFNKVSCKMITLDSYLSSRNIEEVAFVKMDIEGAELTALKGASKLFEQETPPIFEIEMALDTTRGFNYLPSDIIDFINTKAEYDYFAIDEKVTRLDPIETFQAEDVGANVLCFPREHHRERFDKIKGLIKQ